MNVAGIQPPFLLTPYHCSNWFPFVAVVDARRLRIEAKPTPRNAIAWTTGFIGVVFLGFFWLVRSKSPDFVWAVVALGALTIAGTPILIALHFQHEQGQGPVLEYEFNSEFVSLPRLHRRVPRSEIHSFAIVTAYDSGSDWCSQLQLHAKSGERLLLATADTKKELQPILEQVALRTKSPIRFLKQKSKSQLEEESEQ